MYRIDCTQGDKGEPEHYRSTVAIHLTEQEAKDKLRKIHADHWKYNTPPGQLKPTHFTVTGRAENWKTYEIIAE